MLFALTSSGIAVPRHKVLSAVDSRDVAPTRENFPACLYFWDGHERPGDETVTDIVGGIVVAHTVTAASASYKPKSRIDFVEQTPISGTVVQTGTRDLFFIGVTRPWLAQEPIIGCGVVSNTAAPDYPDEGYWVSTYFGGVVGAGRSNPQTNMCVARWTTDPEDPDTYNPYTTFGWAQLVTSIPACSVRFDVDTENQGLYHSNPGTPYPAWEQAQAIPSSHTGAPSANGVTNPINATYVLRAPSPTVGTVNVTGCANRFSLEHCENFCGAAIFAFDPTTGVPADWKLATFWMAQQWYQSQVNMVDHGDPCRSTLWPGWIGRT